MDESFNPGKHGMLSCIECDGNGKLLNEFEDIEVCPRCGGFGFIKKEEDPDKNGIVSLTKIKNVEEKSDL